MELENLQEGRNIIEDIKEYSIAQELDIKKGDILLSINGSDVKDIIDYKYLITDELIDLKIQKPNGDIWEYEIEKEFDEDLGIVFTNPLIDKAKNCRNKCIFCFIDQLPPGMRETLYFKDDDSRLSFLQGNFITLTNMTDDEINRIINYRISPINVSVHTTNPELRIKMLNNKNAGKIYNILKKFHEANLEINCQIVLVPGINDKEELDRTLKDLVQLYPSVKSVAVVPVGITKYRDGLAKVNPYDSVLSANLLDYINNIQGEFLSKIGTRFVFPSDEFYALSKRELPAYEEYEGFPQLENGVGLMKSFEFEVNKELLKVDKKINHNKSYIIATGTLAYNYMINISEKICTRFNNLKLEVIPIINEYFGEKITVSGLITGFDLISQLKGKNIDGIIIPRSMLKNDEEIFLDNFTVEDVSKELGAKVIVSKVSGSDFVNIFREEVN
ncbi:DUF512 domain-containing protein [Wansuia hejianensis]|uniref:DUF512 domain-containing protein n=1 Tax=Wansuia hejianensis TaxID=2763667 RepID=A0A926IMB0_9FIRM|nr:DUF512 domain-containing protein [Wansuia hejianensis]MBC8590431.1 DUF512 domain-containing protein [Wansuia hejianensis]